VLMLPRSMHTAVTFCLLGYARMRTIPRSTTRILKAGVKKCSPSSRSTDSSKVLVVSVDFTVFKDLASFFCTQSNVIQNCVIFRS
jgi:hypothetical protein